MVLKYSYNMEIAKTKNYEQQTPAKNYDMDSIFQCIYIISIATMRKIATHHIAGLVIPSFVSYIASKSVSVC